MASGIYLIKDNGELVEMRQTAYDSEDLLQELLANYPSVLAGDESGRREPRRWLLITREAPVPGEEGGSGRWSADHLFLDQEAVPTIVEVKRSTDTRIRREVVGQMLDYAANGVVYWPVDRLREMLLAQCEGDVALAQDRVVEVAGEDADVDDFWAQAAEHLRAGRVRMVFVSDSVPRELMRVVEFLNGQMSPAEVIAIEVKQYVAADGTTTLVPRVLGQT